MVDLSRDRGIELTWSNAGAKLYEPHFAADLRRSLWSLLLRMRLQSGEHNRTFPLFQLDGDCEVIAPHTTQGPENLRMATVMTIMPHKAIGFKRTTESGRNFGRNSEA